MVYFNDLEILALLKLLKVPVFIDYLNSKEGKIHTIFPIFVVNTEENIKIFDLPVKNSEIDNFIKKDFNYLHELIEEEIITLKDLKEILQYY